MSKIKDFIKGLQLRWSDLCLFIGFLPFAIFLIFGQLFMQYPNPDDVALKLWAIILCFVVMIGSWGAYIYLEFKKENRPKDYITWTFIFLAIISIITIAIQPRIFVEDVVVRMINDGNIDMGKNIGDTVPVTLNISTTHYMFFTMDILAILLFIYIGLFIFPKRFTSLSFMPYFGYALFVFLGVLILYGYIFEFNNYIGFFKYIFGQGNEGDNIYTYAVKSFIIHRNAYGMAMMIGIIFCYFNHSIEHKWWYYLIAGILFINMLFSVCKTGILISLAITAVYVIYRLIITYKEHPKRNRNIFIVAGSVILLAGFILGIVYLGKGKFLAPIYSLISSLGGSSTLDFRVYIWDNCFQILRNGWWIIGRGFGLMNMMLLPMNTVNGDKVFPAHSAYMTLLTEGGIFFLLAYICLLGYVIYLIIKSYKSNPNMTVAFSLGLLAWVLYSFIEAIHYLAYVFMFPIFVLYHLSTLENKSVEENKN